MSNTTSQVIGFIGLGVMGEPICRNLAVKTGARFTHVPYQGNAQATNDHLYTERVRYVSIHACVKQATAWFASGEEMSDVSIHACVKQATGVFFYGKD